jgi:hypothetical protein
MKNKTPLKWIIPLIFLLTLAATLAGLWPAAGESYPITNFRGEQVTINARGLYYWDTLSSAAQMQANDLVTLFVGLPLLAASFWLSLRGSLRGKLLLTGTLGFILYTYITMCFGTAYNSLFLVYVADFSLSLFAFVLSIQWIDQDTLPARFSNKLPRRLIAGLFFFTSAFLMMAWLGRIAPTLLQNQIPLLENTTSMFIQVLDLGIIVPTCILSAILLLRRSAWGYLLSSVAVMKFLSMGLAVSLMGFNMVRVGVPADAAGLAIFPTITLINLVLAVILLKNIKPESIVA